MKKHLKNTLIFLICCVVASVALLKQLSPMEEWALKAPLETVTVKKGQTATSFVKERVPAKVRGRGDMTYAISLIGDRQDRKLGTLQVGDEIQVPIPYEEWKK